MSAPSRQPVLFLAHGAPLTAIRDTLYTRYLDRLGETLRPRAVLLFTAHWESPTTTLTARDTAHETIHDFGPWWPEELFAVRYPAPGSTAVAAEVLCALRSAGLQATTDPDRGLDHGAWTLLRSTPVLKALGISAFLYYLAHESLPSIFVLYTDLRFGWGPAMVGGVLAAVGIATTIVSGAVVRPAVRKLGEWRALAVGLSAGAISFALYALAPNQTIFLIGIPFGAIWGLSGPAEQALMSREIGPQAQGQLQGALGSVRGIAGMVAPLLFAQIFAASVSFNIFPGAAYLLAAILLAASLAVAWSGKPK